MKNISIFASSLLFLASAIGNASAKTPAHLYANAISANNIAVMQHSILSTAMNSGDRLSSAVHDAYAPQPKQTTEHPDKNIDPSKIYGRAPMYGTAPMYGEFNDDGSQGRSGGDGNQPTLGNMWIAWQHYGNDTKFDDTARLDSDMDLVMLGLAGNKTAFSHGMTEWGLYTGYVGSDQENDSLAIDENGGYFGVYKKFIFDGGKFNILSSLNGGVLSNSAETTYGTDEYTNIWAGGALNATYNIALDRTFTLQPALYAGYTWIKSENYTATSGEVLKNDNFHMFELTPAIRAIKHIGNGWYGAIGAKYVILFANGGDLDINGITADELEFDNFTEYGLTLEKTVDNFGISANIGRRDGARDGWTGGLNLKYLF